MWGEALQAVRELKFLKLAYNILHLQGMICTTNGIFKIFNRILGQPV
ncbi:MAG: hypothetical protein JETT_0466 [Candidatus Jettenia ecosi]|uniref:Uncharacterized protein n=1 Tax=Candidatus Jettenia ecosi TaxID=2494326 RepID=A0A533QEV1_9BACT|nr:MAG: hypothetical protein JETT_0466 [Candidatus Jettenia ecosi]